MDSTWPTHRYDTRTRFGTYLVHIHGASGGWGLNTKVMEESDDFRGLEALLARS